MTNDRTEVRRVLDTVKAEGRTSLTAPEGKVVCEAYGISRTRGRRGDVGRRRGGDRHEHGLSGRAQDRVAGNSAQDRSGRRAGRREERRGRAEGLRHHHRQREEVQRQGQPARRPGAADARRRTGSHHRRGHRSRVRQAGRVRPGRRPGRSAQGHHVPARARDKRRRAVDDRRHRRRADSQGRPRRRSRSIATRSRR